ncbi:MAG: hypothetical protein ACK5M3_04975 [Dysgonomonas sp.]
MGQDYSNISYKKTYTGDYIKSYKSGHVYIYEPPTQDKKQSKDSVLAEGRRRTPRAETRPIAKTPKAATKKTEVKSQPAMEQKVEPKEIPVIEPVIEIKPKLSEPSPKPQIKIDTPPQKAEAQKEELPPLFDLEGIFNKKKEDTNPQMLKYPIKHLHGTTYLDVFSGREISEDRARELLHAAGFTPKTSSGIIPIFIGILAVFFFGYFGLVPIMLTGFWLFKKDNTTYTKIDNMEKLSISMPATKYEMMIYKFQAVICFIVAVVTFATRTIQV